MIKGLVQGVGFRPFICRLAAKHGLSGVVDNRTNGVSVIVQCDAKAIDRFTNEILTEAPPASRIKAIEVIPTMVEGYDTFTISHSKAVNDQITEISPDIAVCKDCLADMQSDPSRIDYPFINCTNCGPRFTIIEGIPYDRPKTSMKEFQICGKCNSEYNDILDRRFHAQPVACNSCGPKYTLIGNSEPIKGIHKIIGEISERIDSGQIIAIKGIGGYNLMCDALNDIAVQTLRTRKQRDAKPFAVMFRDISAVREYCFVNDSEEKELISWRRPIILLRMKKSLAASVCSGLTTTGAMLPYMPIHYLMFRSLKSPVVVLTSGNISDEPIITDDREAEEKLLEISETVLSYDRKIINRIDDSVVRAICNNIILIRRSRGFVPRPVDLDINVEGILAMGAEQKNSFCIGKGNQAILSQYIGDLKNIPTCDFYLEMINRFEELFRFKPGFIACDMHPDYFSSVLALELGEKLRIPVVKVQHHHAHIVSVMAENGIDEKVIGISFDGTGYGTDGNTWGGEFMIADRSDFTRYTHFDYVPMPGGDKVVDEPWRMAFSYLYKYSDGNLDPDFHSLFKSVDKRSIALITDMIKNRINSPFSSGAGRLFDAVSALTGLCQISSFDSEGPMRLESAADPDIDGYYPYKYEKTIIFRETIKCIIDDLHNNSVKVISAKFHNTLAHVILEVSEKIRKETSLDKVVMSGGVFQNKYLLEKSLKLLMNAGFNVFFNRQVPANDGGISLGQIVVASKTLGLCA